jgi:tRNA(Ile)-lysidine synthetase-like protein
MDYKAYVDVLDEDFMNIVNNESLTDKQFKANKLVIAMKEYIDKKMIKYPDMTYIGISLSGGVDSAVITKAYHRIFQLYEYRLKIVAIHVKYNNREASKREAAFLELWCENLGIIYEQMNIDDISRDTIARDLYEEVSRERRYDLYKKMIKKYNIKGIFVGHHAGDIVENVFTNMMKGRTITDLCVMHPQSLVNGVMLWRPMLNFYKDIVFDLAHSCIIPYFKDTTPEWSNRGIMRNEIFPMLEKQYGKVFYKNLYSIGMESVEEGKIYEDKILDPFLDTIYYGQFGIIIDYTEFIEYDKFFWSTALMKIFHKRSMKMISKKVLRMIIDAIHKNKETCLNIQNDTLMYLYGGKMIICPDKFATLTPVKKNVMMGNNFIEQGWSITISDTTVEKEISLKNIVDGDISYSVRYNKTDGTLTLFGKPTKWLRNRININKKMFKSLPFIISNNYKMTDPLINISLIKI